MTICIIAMCENKSKIIVASDRMITIGSIIEFEHRDSKIEKLSNNCVAVTAGNALAHTDLFKNVKPIIASHTSLSISDIVQKLKNIFIEQRKKKVEELFLKSRGFNIDDFYIDLIRSVPPEIGIPLDNQIEHYDFSLEIIVGGVDDEGAHIYFIENPGTSDCFDSVGFCAIGSGELHAILTFISYNYAQDISLNEALYVIYEAKRISEKAPGVGEDTDIWVIDKNEIIKLSEENIESLNNIYNKKKELELNQHNQIKEIIDQISIKKK